MPSCSHQGLLRLVGLVTAVLFGLATRPVSAESDAMYRPDRTHAPVIDLGNGFLLHRDPHGPLTPLPQVSRPPGSVLQDPTISPNVPPTAFGIPAPPSNLTPAPVLPFHPHSPLVPHPAIPPGSHRGVGGAQGR